MATAATSRFTTARLLGDRGPVLRMSPYWVHPPSPRQALFLSLPHMEALYGGAGYGGKTDALLMAALQYVDVPGYSALLLRRTYTQLTKSGQLLDMARTWLRGTDAQWNDVEAKWMFPSGATIAFGHLDSERDLENYSGPSYQFIGVDELTQFPEHHYRFLFTRLRRLEEMPVPVRMRGATNPGGRGHRWVKSRFVDEPRDPGRMFIPAKVTDNPAADVPMYLRSLDELDPQTRAQIRDGDWNAREPGDWVFPEHLDKVMELGARHDQMRAAGTMPPPVGSQLVLCADWGVHSHLLLLWPLEGGGFHVAREVVYEGTKVRLAAPPVADAVRSLGWPVHVERFDASMPGLNEAFLEELGQHMPRPKFLAVPFGKFKKLAVDYLATLVHNTGIGEVAPLLSVSEAGCPVLADQLRGWKYADPDSGRIEKGDDHGPDALVAGVAPEAAKRGRHLTTPLERTTAPA